MKDQSRDTTPNGAPKAAAVLAAMRPPLWESMRSAAVLLRSESRFKSRRVAETTSRSSRRSPQPRRVKMSRDPPHPAMRILL